MRLTSYPSKRLSTRKICIPLRILYLRYLWFAQTESTLYLSSPKDQIGYSSSLHQRSDVSPHPSVHQYTRGTQIQLGPVARPMPGGMQPRPLCPGRKTSNANVPAVCPTSLRFFHWLLDGFLNFRGRTSPLELNIPSRPLLVCICQARRLRSSWGRFERNFQCKEVCCHIDVGKAINNGTAGVRGS